MDDANGCHDTSHLLITIAMQFQTRSCQLSEYNGEFFEIWQLLIIDFSRIESDCFSEIQFGVENVRPGAGSWR